MMDDDKVGQITGDLLRRARRGRHLSLAQVEQQTRIRVRYLDAIEEDDLSTLPAPVFTMGLIENYAQFLDLDPVPFVEAYKRRIGKVPEPTVLPETSRFVPPRRGVPPFVAVVTVVGLLLLLTGYLYQQVAAFVSGSALAPRPTGTSVALVIPTPIPSPVDPTVQAITTPNLPTIKQQATATPRPVRTQTVVPTATPPLPPTPTMSPTSTPISGVHIDATISGRVWVEVQADGKVVFVGVLHNGDKRSWSAHKTIMIWSGNAAYVSVTYNGKKLGPLGSPGEVVKVTWTATS